MKCRTTLSVCPAGSTRPGAEISPTWCARRITCASSRKRTSSRTPQKSASIFLKSLQELQRDEPIVTAVRGRGLFLAFDLPDPKTRDEFWKGLFDRGALVLKSGERAIRFRPALDISTEVVDEAMELLRQQCQQMRRNGIVRATWPESRVATDGSSVRLPQCNRSSINSASLTTIRALSRANGAAAAPSSKRFRPSTESCWAAFAPLRRKITKRRSGARRKHF